MVHEVNEQLPVFQSLHPLYVLVKLGDPEQFYHLHQCFGDESKDVWMAFSEASSRGHFKHSGRILHETVFNFRTVSFAGEDNQM